MYNKPKRGYETEQTGNRQSMNGAFDRMGSLLWLYSCTASSLAHPVPSSPFLFLTSCLVLFIMIVLSQSLCACVKIYMFFVLVRCFCLLVYTRYIEYFTKGKFNLSQISHWNAKNDSWRKPWDRDRQRLIYIRNLLLHFMMIRGPNRYSFWLRIINIGFFSPRLVQQIIPVSIEAEVCM